LAIEKLTNPSAPAVGINTDVIFSTNMFSFNQLYFNDKVSKIAGQVLDAIRFLHSNRPLSATQLPG
jgi:hypothetical protein